MSEMGGAGGDLPNWLVQVSGAIGIVIATLVARLGWKSLDRTKSGGVTVEGHVAGAVVDSSSIDRLTKAVDSLTEAIKESKLDDRMEDLGEEVRRLGDEVRALGIQIERH